MTSPTSEESASSTTSRVGEPQVVIPFRPPKRFPLRMPVMFLVVVLLAGSVLELGLVLGEGSVEEMLPVVLGLLSLAALLVVLGLIPVKSQGQEVALFRDRVRLPADVRSPRLLEIPYREIDSLVMVREEFLWIGTESFSLRYPSSAFVNAQDIDTLHRELRARVLALVPDGEVRLRTFDTQEKAVLATLSNRLWATKGLLVLLAAIYVVEHLTGGLRLFGLLRLGANAKLMVEEGELFRIVSANFLHGNLLHIGLNGLALFVLGAVVERLLGTRNFLLIYFVSAITGAVGSLTATATQISVGASTAVFGLLGAFAYTHYRYREEMPVGFRPALSWWVWVGVLNLALSIFIPQIDLPAHLGGLLGGLLVTAAVINRVDRLPVSVSPSLVEKLALPLLLVVFAAGIGAAVRNYFAPDEALEERVIEASLRENGGQGDVLNRFAWETAIDPGATPRRLRLAEKYAHIALDSADDQARKSAFGDTLATVYYRLGKLDEAVELETTVLTETKDGFIASQLARFIDARWAQRGAKLQPDVASDAIKLELRARPEAADQFSLHVTLPEDLESDITIYALARAGDRLHALVRLGVAFDFSGEAELPDQRNGQPLDWKDVTRVDLGLVMTGAASLDAWPVDSAALALP